MKKIRDWKIMKKTNKKFKIKKAQTKTHLT